MAVGSFKTPLFCVAWPTGELGGMGLEGAVRLGYRKELEAIEDPAERDRTFNEMVDRMYEHGKALNAASYFEIDDVIDPADSRRWITTSFASAPPLARSEEHTSELQSLMRISYAVFCLKKKKTTHTYNHRHNYIRTSTTHTI